MKPIETKKNVEAKSRMLNELEQLKIVGGRMSESSKLSMKNCKVVCAVTQNDSKVTL